LALPGSSCWRRARRRRAPQGLVGRPASHASACSANTANSAAATTAAAATASSGGSAGRGASSGARGSSFCSGTGAAERSDAWCRAKIQETVSLSSFSARKNGSGSSFFLLKLRFFDFLTLLLAPLCCDLQEEPGEEGGLPRSGGRLVVGRVGVAQVRTEAHQGFPLSKVSELKIHSFSLSRRSRSKSISAASSSCSVSFL
jgi:hypothetical protein